MTNSKILLLGGSAQQVIAITTAKKMGLYTVLCDYLPDNPGQYVADKFYTVSTTDKAEVLKIAQKEQVDGIIAYASDPAAPTAAFVAESLKLPTNPYESVEILCNKEKFRSFLAKNGFNTPRAKGYGDFDSLAHEINDFSLPVLIKPVDSSGSKGISLVTTTKGLKEKFDYAMSFSRAKRIIIEEYIEGHGYQVAGDGLSIDGKLSLAYLGNDHFDSLSPNPFVPVAASFPCVLPEVTQEKIKIEVQRLITLLGMKNSMYNFDIRVDASMKIYLMEIAPRSGGNYIPQIIQYATGVNMVECAIKAAMGIAFGRITPNINHCFYSYYAIHSYEEGILEKIDIQKDVLNDNIVESHIIARAGDKIRPFTGANTSLGILIMKFNTMKQMLDAIEKPWEWLQIKLK